MSLILYQVDAFTDKLFGGNPAAVCPLTTWLMDDVLQNIAAENNLSETAFFVQKNEQVFELRWFTPLQEVDLCGHATLAAAQVLFNHMNYAFETITFEAKIDTLTVTQKDGFLVMDFPTQPLQEVKEKDKQLIEKALGNTSITMYESLYHLAVLPNEQAVITCQPDLACIEQLSTVGLIITARGEQVDFVSRFFAPKCGIPEDPVTGSAHCVLTPYWAKVLGKNQFQARQLSKRVGELQCTLEKDRVLIAGKAVTYLKGEIML